jgi:hypothetical protein
MSKLGEITNQQTPGVSFQTVGTVQVCCTQGAVEMQFSEDNVLWFDDTAAGDMRNGLEGTIVTAGRSCSFNCLAGMFYRLNPVNVNQGEKVADINHASAFVAQ